MTQQELNTKAIDIIKKMIDTIADKNYEELASFMQTDPSWVKDGETQKEGFLELGEWIDEQLAMWEEEEEREFKIDHFDESCIDIEPCFDGKQSFCTATCQPMNSGEALDFWFEIEFQIKDNDELKPILNINI